MHPSVFSKTYSNISARVWEALAQSGFDGLKSVGLIGVILVILACVGDLYAESWNGIHPLRSQKADVERVLGKCLENESTSRCLYKLEDKNILIEYSVGVPCGETEAVWNVPNVTVLRITVYQTDGGILLKKLTYDLKRFRREEDPELPGIEHYTQAKKGISFEVEGGFVRSFYYGPLASDRRKFACSSESKSG